MGEGVVRLHHAQGVGGAAVHDDAVANPEDAPVGCQGQFHVVGLVARLDGGGPVLAPLLHPLQGHAQLERQECDDELLGVGQGLDAESAADVGGDHPDPVRRPPERLRQRRPERVGDLGAAPHREEVGSRIVAGHHAARFHGVAGEPPGVQAAPPHVGGRGEGRLDIAEPRGDAQRAIVRPVVVEEGSIRGEGRRGVGHGRKRFQVGDNPLRGIGGGVRIPGDDHGERITDVPDAVGRQQRPVLVAHEDAVVTECVHQPLLEDTAVGLVGRHGREPPGEVGPAPAADAAGDVHADDGRVREMAAHEGNVAHARQLDVGHVVPVATQQAGVLSPPGPGAGRSHRAASAARSSRLTAPPGRSDREPSPGPAAPPPPRRCTRRGRMSWPPARDSRCAPARPGTGSSTPPPPW